MLSFGDNSLTIKNFAHHRQDVYYNTAFDLEVCSGGFIGCAPCEYEISAFREFVDALSEMYDFKKQTVELWEIGYGSRVQFDMDQTGHMKISGKIFGEAMEHSMEFSFMADQTALKSFISGLQQLILD